MTLEDYRSTISSAQKGDFVYLDPPYEPVDKKGSEKIKVGNKSFTSYTAEGFTSADQIALKEQCDKLDRRGIKFALSNSNAAMILELYKDYNVYQFEANRTLNSKKENRKNSAVEILVTNYKVAPTTDIE